MMGIISRIRLLLVFIALNILITPGASTISNKRLCYDPHCEVIISEAVTVTQYNSSDPEILSFQANVHVDVFSKSAGTRDDLWGVKIGDQRGYAPVSLLHEKKVLQRVLQHEVDTNIENNVKEQEKQKQFSSPKVIHGTTLYDPEEESVQNSNYATERSIDITSSQETPILTVHPNKLSTSEVTFDSNPLTETYDFQKDLLTTATSVLTDGDQSTINGIDHNIEQSIENSPEHSQPKETHVQVEEQVLVTSAHFEESANNILPAEISQPLSQDEEKKEISIETIEAVPKISEKKQVENEEADGKNDVDSIFDKETVIETTKTESSEDMVTSAFHKMTSLFSFPTTETPQIVETDNSIDDNIISENKIETENATEINIPEVLEVNTQKDIILPLNTTDELEINEVIDAVDSNEGSNQEIIIKQESNFDEASQNINILDFGGSDQTQFTEKNIEMSTEPSTVIPVSSLEPENIVKKPVQIDHPAVEFKDKRPVTPKPDELVTEIPHQELKIDVVNETLPSLPITLKTQSVITEVKLEEKNNQAYSHLPKQPHESDAKTEESKNNDESAFDDNKEAIGSVKFDKNYWETLSYVCLTAFTTLLFSLGYYYIENTRRDGQLIAKINQLKEKLLVTSKEYSDLDENFKLATAKLMSIEDESFGSNEMVASLKTDLEFAHKSKAELEDQVASLEKDLEGATEAGLELERMLREILKSNNTENPLAKSVEDLQNRLNVQQGVNQSLTNSLQLKTQENEALSKDLSLALQKCEQLEVELARISDELKIEKEEKQSIEETLSLKNSSLEKKLTAISAEKITLKTQLKGKELELKDLLEVVKKLNTSNIDFTKLYDVSQIKAEAGQLLEERDELKIRLSEVEGAHQILEEHMKVINKEIGSLRDQCKLAEKLKSEAETKLNVLSKFFEEKEAERQKEETLWLQQQGEVSSTVNRMHTMHDEIQKYRQQIETLKHEILDQEREYKSQIANLEAKNHDQWVLTRQNERRLEESKAESAQLRNRLTMMDKNFNDSDSDVKMHRLETNGETTSPLYIGVNPSSSPIMFSGAGNVPPPPPPPYFMGPPLPPFMPLPLPPGPTSFDVGQRPPPLGGRLSSPPPMPLYSPPGRYNNHGTPPPPLSPSSVDFIPPPIRGNHSSSAFAHDRNSPPHFQNPPWGDDTLPPSRINSGFHSSHRDQRNRDRRGSLHSSGESLDKSQRRGNIKDLL